MKIEHTSQSQVSLHLLSSSSTGGTPCCEFVLVFHTGHFHAQHNGKENDALKMTHFTLSTTWWDTSGWSTV